MRKLKLQMQLSVDGFVAGLNGEMDWMAWDWDDTLKNYVAGITESVDCILLGRVLAEGFIPTWTARANDPETADVFAHKMVDTPKFVFSKTLSESGWANTRIAADIVGEIQALKQQPGNDIMVYGGSRFVSSLIQQNLIDEYHLFINPVVLGNGMPIWQELNDRMKLKLVNTTVSNSGIVILCYMPEQG